MTGCNNTLVAENHYIKCIFYRNPALMEFIHAFINPTPAIVNLVHNPLHLIVILILRISEK